MYFPVNLNSNHIVFSLLYSGQCTVYTICSVQSSLSLSLLSQVQYSIILQSVFICKSISNYWIIKRFIKKFKEFDLLLFVFSPVLYFTSYVGIINQIGEIPYRLDSIYSPVVTDPPNLHTNWPTYWPTYWPVDPHTSTHLLVVQC